MKEKKRERERERERERDSLNLPLFLQYVLRDTEGVGYRVSVSVCSTQ